MTPTERFLFSAVSKKSLAGTAGRLAAGLAETGYFFVGLTGATEKSNLVLELAIFTRVLIVKMMLRRSLSGPEFSSLFLAPRQVPEHRCQ